MELFIKAIHCQLENIKKQTIIVDLFSSWQLFFFSFTIFFDLCIVFCCNNFFFWGEKFCTQNKQREIFYRKSPQRFIIISWNKQQLAREKVIGKQIWFKRDKKQKHKNTKIKISKCQTVCNRLSSQIEEMFVTQTHQHERNVS